MNQDSVYCSVKYHEFRPITDICILKDCQHNLRWCCKECKKNSIHDHDQQDQSHLVPHYQLQSILRQNITKLLEFHLEHLNQHKIQELQYYFLQCKKMNIAIYKRDFEQLQNNIKSNQNKLLKYLEMIQDCNIFNLDRNLLNEIINIQYDQSVYDYLLLYNQLKNNVTLKLGRNKLILHQSFEPKQYIIKKVDQGQEMYQCCSISNNERYLACGVQDYSLKIYDICSNKMIQEKKVKFPIMQCQFSDDSQYLYVVTFKSVIVYRVTNRFKYIFRQWFYSHGIQKIILLKNQQMVTYAALKIIKTDLKSRKNVFVIMRRRDNIYITALDYNDEIIGVGYSSGSLMLWDCRNRAIIINKRYHNYQLSQIQIISSGTQILISDLEGSLTKYKIDLMNKDLIKIQSYNFREICSFQQVSKGKNLLIICRDSFVILNNMDEVLQKVYLLELDPEDQFSLYNKTKQLDNLKYVVLALDCINIQHFFRFYILSYCLGMNQNYISKIQIYDKFNSYNQLFQFRDLQIKSRQESHHISSLCSQQQFYL